jgi:hypothetical protein
VVNFTVGLGGATPLLVALFGGYFLLWFVASCLEDDESPGITLVVAPIGGGKGMFLAYQAWMVLRAAKSWDRTYKSRDLHEGDVRPLYTYGPVAMLAELVRRRCGLRAGLIPPRPQLYADYWLAGARPWLDWSYIATPAGRGGLYLADELGSSFSSRKTLDVDPAAFFAGSMMRHMHSRVIGCAQNLAFIDIQWRRLCSTVVVVHRKGTDGSKALRLNTSFFLWRPWYFVAHYYRITDFDDAGNLFPTAEPFRTVRFRWRKEIAELYDTTAMMIPPELSQRWREICQASLELSLLPPMKRGLEVGDVFDDPSMVELQVPKQVRGREDKSERPRGARTIAAARGLYVDPDLRDVVGG